MEYALSLFHLLKRLTLHLLDKMALQSSTSVNLISNAHPLTLNYTLGIEQATSKGDRLIFMEKARPQVIDLASFISRGKDEGKKKLTYTIMDDDQNWTLNGDSISAQIFNRLCIAQWTIINTLAKSSTINTVAHWFHVILVITSWHGLLSNCPNFQQKIKREFQQFH